jgi:ribosomal protein S1/HrpA-like RNA helicase
MTGPLRGTSAAPMRTAVCKDCQREIEGLHRAIEKAREADDRSLVSRLEANLAKKHASTFSYSEHSASIVLDRGGSRSDRCTEHRKKHRTNIQGMAVAYVDLATLGEAVGAHETGGPTGPFGGLGPLPDSHKREERSADLAKYEFGMNDRDIVEILETLRGEQRVLVLRAGTGTGKSTFGPFRLMNPPSMADLHKFGIVDENDKITVDEGTAGERIIQLPPQGPFRLTDLGPIIVTEPRVAAATGVARFVGEKLAMGCALKQCPHPSHGVFNPKAHLDDEGGLTGPSCPDVDTCKREHVGPHPWPKIKDKCVVTDCYSHVGPGFPVGYQVSGDRNHDDACQLVFVTDGTMINWLREGRLSRIGTVIVDEAHERSTNIDFIMGYLARDIAKYPHLRVIITSATFEPKFYKEFFETHAGEGIVAVKDVPAVKTVGYGMPLFAELDTSTPAMQEYLQADGHRWPEEAAWPLVSESEPNEERFIQTHWPIKDKEGNPLLDSDGLPLQYAKAPKLKENEVIDAKDVGWQENLWETTRALMPLRFGQADGEKVIEPEKWREQMPTVLADYVIRLANGLDEAGIFGDILGFLPTARTIEEACKRIEAELGDAADVCGLVSSLGDEAIEKALSARRMGEKRKIVISTNLAETSLTVEGVRFVVDSGLIAQSEWDAKMASGGVGTKKHSQAGIKQRWGRAGRKAPGWVFPLYSKEQFAALADDTPPGSARENLEQLMMTARMGGIDDVKGFPWPAAFDPKTIELDESAKIARQAFLDEMDRADGALRSNGAVDKDGHPTSFGKELTRFNGVGSPGSAMAIMYADRLGCVPEVAMILALLEGTRLVGRDALLADSYEWPDEWRVEAASRHRAIASLAEDDAHLALLICGAWERADPGVPPWEESKDRRAWARRWWINDEVLLEAAKKRQAALAALSPSMKEEVKRFVEPSLLNRARGVLARTMSTFEFRREGDAYVESNPVVTLNEDGSPRPQVSYGTERDAMTSVAAERVIALRRRKSGDVATISNLIAMPVEEAIRGIGTNAASSIADAMAMVVAFKEHASPQPMRDVPLALMERFPVGLRVRLTPGPDGVPATAVTNRLDPFERPRTPEELEKDGIKDKRQKRQSKRRKYRDSEEVSSATEADAKGDLGLRYRTGEDDEGRENRRIAAADRSVGETTPCGECPACQAGRRCQVGDDEGQANGYDAIRQWRINLKDAARTAVSNATLVAGSTAGDGEEAWYEVTGYVDATTDTPKITIAPDWRAEGGDADPAKHHEVAAGKAVPVRVAGWVEDHQDKLRVFERVDGKGRFLLREAPASFQNQLERGQIAVSLSAGAQGLLEHLEPNQEFVATVVPARAEGCFTITLLEMLYHHLQQAKGGLTQVLVDPKDPKRGRVGAYPAVVASAPNANGYLTFRVLFEDTARGLRHLVSYKAPTPRGDSPSDADGSGSAPESAQVFLENQPWLLRLKRDEPELGVGGRDLDELEAIVAESARQLSIPRSRGNGRAGDGDEAEVVDDYLEDNGSDDLDGRPIRRAPKKTVLKSKGDLPLSSVLAGRLAELDDSPAWRNTVWSFWARTHHMRLQGDGAVTQGTETEARPLRLAQKDLSDESPAEAARKRVAEFARHHAVDDTVSGAVSDVVGMSGARVQLKDGVEVFVPLSEVSWLWLEDPRDGVQVGQSVQVKLIEIDSDAGKVVGSIRALVPEPYVEYTATHRVGERATATVRWVDPGSVRLTLAPGVDGFLPGRELDWVRIEDPNTILREGQELQVELQEFDDKKRNVVVSRRATLPDPLKIFQDRYAVGSRIPATVSVVEKGFARLHIAAGVEGFLPAREVAHTETEDVNDRLFVGQQLEVEVRRYEIDSRNRGVVVSLKALLPEPYEVFKTRHKEGQRINAVVERVNDKHVNARHESGTACHLFAGQISHERVPDARVHFKAGDRLTAQITAFSDERREVEVSIKAMLPDPWTAFQTAHPINAIVNGLVRKVGPNRAFVDLGSGVSGSIYIRNVTGYRLESFAGHLTEGQRYDFRILGYDTERKQVDLSRVGLPAGNPATSAFPARPAAQAPPLLRAAPPPPPRVTPPPPRHAASPPPPRTPRSTIAEGGSVQEATGAGCRTLGLAPGQAVIEVLDPGERSFLGRVKRRAKVRVMERI